MGDTTNIGWCDHTFNPWMGCTKVSEACRFCYAECDMDHRYGKAAWGPNGTRRKTAPANWRKPLKWNRDAENAGERRRVFCASLADVFEDWKGAMHHHQGGYLHRDPNGGRCYGSDTMLIGQSAVTMNDLRAEVFHLPSLCSWLDWLFLTKRPGNVCEMVPPEWLQEWPKNAWLGTSVENQEAADTRIGHLLQCPAAVKFVSCEPLLGRLELSQWLRSEAAGNESRRTGTSSTGSIREGKCRRHTCAGETCSGDATTPKTSGSTDTEDAALRCASDGTTSSHFSQTWAAGHRRGTQSSESTTTGTTSQETAAGHSGASSPETSLTPGSSQHSAILEHSQSGSEKLASAAERSAVDLIAAYRQKRRCNNITWVIIGCESGPKRRETKLEWVEDLVDQCQRANVAVFVKQLDIGGKVETDVDKFPPHLRLREFPVARAAI